MKKVLITGVTGQIGSSMADYILSNTNCKVVGCIRSLSVDNHSNISHLKDDDRFSIIDLDICDKINTSIVIQEEKPDYFINCAANSFVGNSWSMPYNHFETNALSVLYQLESIRRHAPKCRYITLNSSEMFGDVEYSPQDINHPLKPRSPYGVSKCSSHLTVKVYRESYNLNAVSAINFNTEGVRRGHKFVTRKISLGVAEIYSKMKNAVKFKPIELGNLNAKRDWQDTSDCVDGLWKMLNQDGSPKDYVLASGEAHSIREFVESAFKHFHIEGEWRGTGLNERYVFEHNGVVDSLVKVNPEFYRPNELEFLHGDSNPLRDELGWSPRVGFKELVSKMVASDYEEIRRKRL